MVELTPWCWLLYVFIVATATLAFWKVAGLALSAFGDWNNRD
jgi:hypothetical protein